jgi:hypothetical protein
MKKEGEVDALVFSLALIATTEACQVPNQARHYRGIFAEKVKRLRMPKTTDARTMFMPGSSIARTEGCG